MYMKTFIKTASKFTLVAALAGLAFLNSCKSDEPTLSDEQRVTKILTDNGGKWNLPAVAGVTVDGLDVTQDLFKDFSITFGEGTLTTTGTTPVWLRQDTWSFKDQSAKIIVRGQDNKEITISEITDNQLVLTLEWEYQTFEGGRAKSIKGTHQFTMEK